MNNVFGPGHPAYPVVEIASRSRVLHVGENPTCPPEAGDNPDWMRWNNLGIAYLDQLQYSDAVRAFSEVVKLRPDYPDAYTNIALTEIQWEKYDSARASIQRALALSPDNARALYYLALLERRAGDYDAEIANLKKVVEQFPAVTRCPARSWPRLLPAARLPRARECSLRPCSRSTPMI